MQNFTQFAVQCSAMQCKASQCSAVQGRAVQCSAVQCSAVYYNALQCSSVQCSTLKCSAVQCIIVKCIAVQCSTPLEQRAAPVTDAIFTDLSPNLLSTALLHAIQCNYCTALRNTISNKLHCKTLYCTELHYM